MKVLIIDDAMLAGYAIKSYFEKLGHEVVGLTRNGEAGKILYEEKEPDLVTVDAVMPRISGIDVVKYINDADAGNGRRTIVYMISSDPVSDEDKIFLLVNEYIRKPVTLNKIRELLDKLQ